MLTALGAPAWAADAGYAPAEIRPDLAPDQSKYDPADEDLRDAAGRLQLALNADNVKVPAVPHFHLIKRIQNIYGKCLALPDLSMMRSPTSHD